MPYRTHDTIPVWGQLQDSALQQIKNCLKHDKAVSAALMADHHHGYVQPIGGVIAYHEAISPSGVGYDIACGNKAVRLDISAIETRNNISTIMSDITNAISFGVGSKNKQPVDHALFHDPIWKLEPLSKWKNLAMSQLGLSLIHI